MKKLFFRIKKGLFIGTRFFFQQKNIDNTIEVY